MPAKKKQRRNISGVLLLDKPLGLSSNTALQKVKRLFNASKAGHTGALDPLATGVLPICLGESTKFSQFLLDSDKAYATTAKLGVRTASCDAESEVTETKPVPKLSLQQVDAILEQNLRGTITQVPPIYSALKVDGVPMYKLARQGIAVEVKSRQVTIFRIDITAMRDDEIDLEIHCSKGTYIRSIVDELGQLLGCGAHVSMLRRLSHADYHIQDSYTLEQLQQLAPSLQTNKVDSLDSQQQSASDSNQLDNQPVHQPDNKPDNADFQALDTLLLSADSPVQSLPKIELSQAQSQTILSGQFLKFDLALGYYRLFIKGSQQFIGLGEITEKHGLKPHRIISRT